MRVERIFAFVDLCGFTRFTDLQGDESAVALLADFRLIVREVASRRGVRVAKWLGDGAMFVAVEGHPLVAAVLEIEQRVDALHGPLTLRAGMTCGAVILFEGDDYIGSAVNLAARLCDLAEPHQVLSPASMADLAPPWARVTPAGPVVLPGFATAVPLVRMQRWEHAAATVVDPVCGMTLPADGAATSRFDGSGRVAFCSVGCAIEWDRAARSGAHEQVSA